jgi:two-component system chemotaxis response regulator CheY
MDMSEPTIEEKGAPTGINILVVDDSAMMRTMIKRAAAATGLPIGNLYEAADGQQALAILQQHDVDALFTDINMPVMTGIELLRQIAGHERWQNLVRVIISTDGSEARRNEAGALGVRLYVGKPFRPEVMRDVLSELTTTR